MLLGDRGRFLDGSLFGDRGSLLDGSGLFLFHRRVHGSVGTVGIVDYGVRRDVLGGGLFVGDCNLFFLRRRRGLLFGRRSLFGGDGRFLDCGSLFYGRLFGDRGGLLDGSGLLLGGDGCGSLLRNGLFGRCVDGDGRFVRGSVAHERSHLAVVVDDKHAERRFRVVFFDFAFKEFDFVVIVVADGIVCHRAQPPKSVISISYYHLRATGARTLR